ncbi:GIY-YIG nuclease family protein [Amphibacillus jilinensis]|uniref:GIY-YIG nuclease family protein n=1 Tax=Amphibacillus jilinensis TaxID=1216008 RepID=UPI000366BD0A|nr:GIY-YIG nuclease family protein [Amphibacillus jilinensis]
MSIEHVVYILECKDGSLYTGYTNNLSRRLRMHEQGKGAKYTRGRSPFRLCYQEQFESKTLAMQMEYRIKQLSRAEKEQLIQMKKEGECIAGAEELSD